MVMIIQALMKIPTSCPSAIFGKTCAMFWYDLGLSREMLLNLKRLATLWNYNVGCGARLPILLAKRQRYAVRLQYVLGFDYMKSLKGEFASHLASCSLRIVGEALTIISSASSSSFSSTVRSLSAFLILTKPASKSKDIPAQPTPNQKATL
jgi:hypothetical protein